MAIQEYIYVFTQGPGQGGVRIPFVYLGDFGTIGTDLKEGVSCGNYITGYTQAEESGEKTFYGLLPLDINKDVLIDQLPSSHADEDPFFSLPNYGPNLYNPAVNNTIRKVYTPPIGDNPPLYPQDIQTRWKDKYYTLETVEYFGQNCDYLYNLETFTPYNPNDEHPYVVPVPLYEIVEGQNPTKVFWTGENRCFGFSHFWRPSYPSGQARMDLTEFFRVFCNAGPRFNTTAKLLPKYVQQNSETEIFSATSVIGEYGHFESWRSESVPFQTVPEDRQNELSAIFVKFRIGYSETIKNQLPADWPEDRRNGDTFIALVVFGRDRNTGLLVATTKAAAFTSNWFDVDANERDDNDGEDEPETGMGIRPARINQYPYTNIGTQFDLGLTRIAPGSTGIKLFTCDHIASINAYLTEYISTHNPTFDDPSDLVKLFSAASSEAIFNNAYSSLIDVYKLPFAPDGTSRTANQFNICGEVISGEGETVFPNLYWGWNQQKIIDCGNISLPEIYDLGWTNYAPFTKATIAIPFCGVFEIPINAFMGGSITLEYSVDCLTGACTAYVFGVDRDNHSTLIGTFAGDMKLPVPLGITAANTSIIGQALRGGVSSLGKAMTFGGSSLFGNGAPSFFDTSAGAPTTRMYGNQAFETPTTMRTGINMSLGNAAALGGMGLQMIANAGQLASDIKSAPVELSSVIGQIGAASGWNNFPIPYVRLDCPVIKEPSAYKEMIGRPANLTIPIREIGENTFCKAKGFIPSIFRATANEAIEIRQILTTGFYT